MVPKKILTCLGLKGGDLARHSEIEKIEAYESISEPDIDPIGSMGIMLQTYMTIYGNIWQIYGNGISHMSRPIGIATCDKLWQGQETSWIFPVDVLARPIHHYLARSRKPFWCFSANG